MSKIIISLLALLMSSATLAGELTEALVLDLLAKEKQYMQAKDFQGYASLLTEDFQAAFKDRTVGREDALFQVSRLFLSASKILFMPELLSMKVAKDGQSAEIQLRVVEKYLYEIGPRKNVESYSNLSAAIVVLEGGVAKYKFSRYIRTE